MASDPLKGYDTSLDFYSILSVDSTSPLDAITKAYRQLALRHHPDKVRSKSAAADATFLNITKAYEVLSDDHKRAAYDHLWKAKREKEVWKAQQSAKKRKLQGDLEELERQAAERWKRARDAREAGEQEVEQIREENQRALNEIRSKAEAEAVVTAQVKVNVPPIKVTWKDMNVTEDLLRSLLTRKYGRLATVAIKKRKALMVFEEMEAAIKFMETRGKDTMLSWIRKASWVNSEGEVEAEMPELVKQSLAERKARLAKEQDRANAARPTPQTEQPHKMVDEAKEADLLARLRSFRQTKTPG